MNEIIKKAFEGGKLILLLGAGASCTSFDRQGNNVLMGNSLSRHIAESSGLPYSGEDLKTTYTAAKSILGDRLQNILELLFKHCKPSESYNTIAKYPFARIYTLNIDDAFDVALRINSKQKINFRVRKSSIHEQDMLYIEMDYIKLNGSIDRPEDGYIFSPKDYADESNKQSPWYQELAQDYHQYTFLFIGTTIDEPVFYQQIERHAVKHGATAPTAFLITPSITPIKKQSLFSEYKIEHIAGTLDTFAQWLLHSYPIAPSTEEIACNRTPPLRAILTNAPQNEKDNVAKLFSKMITVSRSNLALFINSEPGKIRDFYRGFKPTWGDIVDGVPAILKSTTDLIDLIESEYTTSCNFIVTYGPAGSGKSTILRQSALSISESSSIHVYFVEGIADDLYASVQYLERTAAEKYILFIDRIDSNRDDLLRVFNDKIIHNGLIVGCESQNIWESRTKAHLGHYAKTIKLSTIDEKDADKILEKLEQFGPWTRLGKMTPAQRRAELLTKSKRQLLIGLLESTLGKGFEKIIEDDYLLLTSGKDKTLFTIVGLATIHRSSLSEKLAMRALASLDIESDISIYETRLAGIIHFDNNRLTARHPVYVRHLFQYLTPKDLLQKCIYAILSAYTVYDAPIIKHVGKQESSLFRSLINHKFLNEFLKKDKLLILGIYQSFEKHFETDGLYWLQYGLALRDFDDQENAYHKLLTAFEAHKHPHTEHALAQQELILADRIDSKTKALALLNTAKERLLKLDKVLISDDTYPLVTLSEAQTKITLRHEGVDAAKIVAKEYANILSGRIKRSSQDIRLQTAWTRLTTFATTGEWIEAVR
ncbi:P-loop NTPase [Humidesulfovibrio idahonensis]